MQGRSNILMTCLLAVTAGCGGGGGSGGGGGKNQSGGSGTSYARKPPTVGATATETVTNWRDVVMLASVRETTTITISGAVPTIGYAVSIDRELQTPP